MTRYFALLFIISVLFSCADKPGRNLLVGDEMIADSINAECPYLTRDTKGNNVLSWVRTINDNTTAFCYSISGDQEIFSKVNTVPYTQHIQPHGENLPKIVFKPNGDIICLWGEANPGPSNKYAGRVFYNQSFDGGKSWTLPIPLVVDTLGKDQRYYDVAILPNGEAAITWLDNRKTTHLEGSALYYAVTAGRNGFKNEKLISQPCCQCCRTDLYVDSKGYIHVLYRAIIRDSLRDMVHIVSTDNGETFIGPTRISDDNWVINGCPHTGPAMAETNNGLAFAWFTGGANKGSYFSRSADNGLHFTPRSAISTMGSHPQLASYGDHVAMVWDETHGTGTKFQKQIGIQLRSNTKESIESKLITPDTGDCSYPVIYAAANSTFILAYTKKVNSINYVVARKVTVTDRN